VYTVIFRAYTNKTHCGEIAFANGIAVCRYSPASAKRIDSIRVTHCFSAD